MTEPECTRTCTECHTSYTKDEWYTKLPNPTLCVCEHCAAAELARVGVANDMLDDFTRRFEDVI